MNMQRFVEERDATMADDDAYQTKLNGREMARVVRRREPEKRLRDIPMGLANGMDIYALGFREGFRDAGGRE